MIRHRSKYSVKVDTQYPRSSFESSFSRTRNPMSTSRTELDRSRNEPNIDRLCLSYHHHYLCVVFHGVGVWAERIYALCALWFLNLLQSQSNILVSIFSFSSFLFFETVRNFRGTQLSNWNWNWTTQPHNPTSNIPERNWTQREHQSQCHSHPTNMCGLCWWSDFVLSPSGRYCPLRENPIPKTGWTG